MAEKTMLLTCLLLLIIMQHNFGLSVQASRMLNNIHPPPATLLLKSPQPPSLDLWYSINDEKGNDQGDAFRPTSPGHSPGVGHQAPPP
uniref:Encoded peptide n=1 Tax=Cajanus cajan TaxID=3821 RepID=A0A151SI30_CAJCA|nr:hypothetical protein KK1_000603 [Cajanus cajan]